MSINTSGVGIKNVVAAGVAVQQVRLGTGTTNVEAWSALSWPVTGTVGTTNIPGGDVTQIASFVIPADGVYTITWSATITSTPSSSGRAYLYFDDVRQPGSGNLLSTPGTSTATLSNQNLSAGTVVDFRFIHLYNSGTLSSGSWSINKAG